MPEYQEPHRSIYEEQMKPARQPDQRLADHARELLRSDPRGRDRATLALAVVELEAELVAAERARDPVPPSAPWRTGRKVGRTIYAQIGPEPSDADVLIGVMDAPELAARAVANAAALAAAEQERDELREDNARLVSSGEAWMERIAQLEGANDSLTLELEAERHVHRKDNEYLLGVRDTLWTALKRISRAHATAEHLQGIADDALASLPAPAEAAPYPREWDDPPYQPAPAPPQEKPGE